MHLVTWPSYYHDGRMSFEPDGSDLLGNVGTLRMHEASGEVVAEWRGLSHEKAVKEARAAGYSAPPGRMVG